MKLIKWNWFDKSDLIQFNWFDSINLIKLLAIMERNPFRSFLDFCFRCTSDGAAILKKKMWNVSSKKVIDRVWRKTSFDCKGKPFFKNAHSNSQKLVKSLRVNHFDSTTSKFRRFVSFSIFEFLKFVFQKKNGPGCLNCRTIVTRSDMDNLSSLWDRDSH